jgi:hypothetical protein
MPNNQYVNTTIPSSLSLDAYLPKAVAAEGELPPPLHLYNPDMAYCPQTERYSKNAALDPVTNDEIRKIASTIRQTHWQSSARWRADNGQMAGAAVGTVIDPG